MRNLRQTLIHKYIETAVYLHPTCKVVETNWSYKLVQVCYGIDSNSSRKFDSLLYSWSMTRDTANISYYVLNYSLKEINHCYKTCGMIYCWYWTFDRPILNNKCEKKAPKKVHKSEREKRKRDKQNDLFGELGNMLGTCSLQIESAISSFLAARHWSVCFLTWRSHGVSLWTVRHITSSRSM
jgi:hypothetical protein